MTRREISIGKIYSYIIRMRKRIELNFAITGAAFGEIVTLGLELVR